MEKNYNLLGWVLIVTAFMIVLNFSEIKDKFSGPIHYDATKSGEVVLYGTTWCGYCRKTRDFFNAHNIPFEDLDVEKSLAAQREFERIGGRGVPVVTVGKDVVHGYNIARLRKLLNCKTC